MVSRYTGACLGLLAFAITIVAGLAVHNPPMVTLSRAVWALVIFCPLGLLVGACAQSVITEHYRQREASELGAARDGDRTDESPGDAEDAESAEAKVVQA
jgi:hypothetical protein